MAAQALLLVALVLLPLLGGTQPTSSVARGMTRVGEVLSVLGVLGVAVAAAGLGRGLTASPLPNAAASLRTTGLYAYVRHPIYTFVLLFGLGRLLTGHGNTSVLLCFAAFLGLLILLNAKARWEEARLRERFPEYEAYARATNRFLPTPKGRVHGTHGMPRRGP